MALETFRRLAQLTRHAGEALVMMDHVQNQNAGSLWDKLTALGYANGR